VKQPEGIARECVVVVRIAEIEVAQDLLVDQEEPQEAVILAGTVLQGPGEIGWVANSGKDMPGSGEEKEDEDATDGAKTLPRPSGEELAREKEKKGGGSDGDDDADEALEEQARGETGSEERSPEPGMGLNFVESAQKSEQRECDGERESDVGDLDARKEEEADAGGDTHAGVEGSLAPEGPEREAGSEAGKSDGGERVRKAGSPIVMAEQEVRGSDHPIVHGGFFEVGDTIDARGDPVVRSQHVGGNLGLHGVDVVHQ